MKKKKKKIAVWTDEMRERAREYGRMSGSKYTKKYMRELARKSVINRKKAMEISA